jgi:hypothetical protein
MVRVELYTGPHYGVEIAYMQILSFTYNF